MPGSARRTCPRPSPLRGRPASIEVCEERRSSWEPRGADDGEYSARDEVEVRREETYRSSSDGGLRSYAGGTPWCLDITRLDSTFRPHVKTEPPSVRPLRPAPGQRCERLEDSDRVIRFTDYTDILFDHVFLRLCPVVDLHLNSNHHGTYRMEMACRRAVGGSLSARSHQSRTAGSLTAGSRPKAGESRRHHSTRFAAASL